MSKCAIVKANGFEIETELITGIELVDSTVFMGDGAIKTQVTPTQYDMRILLKFPGDYSQEINFTNVKNENLKVLLPALVGDNLDKVRYF